MTKPVDLLVDVLAVQRITRLATEDTIFDNQREWIVINASDKIAELVTCPHCISIYAGGVAVLLRTVVPRLWKPLATVLALSAATSLKTETFETFGRHTH